MDIESVRGANNDSPCESGEKGDIGRVLDVLEGGALFALISFPYSPRAWDSLSKSDISYYLILIGKINLFNQSLFDLKSSFDNKMNTFPDHINVSQSEERKTQAFLRLQGLARQEIYELIIKGDERDYFDTSKFSERYTKRDQKLTSELMTRIVKELNDLGWKTQYSFGGTGLFIFADKKPSNCYDDGL
jgi:hypothetical protein